MEKESYQNFTILLLSYLTRTANFQSEQNACTCDFQMPSIWNKSSPTRTSRHNLIFFSLLIVYFAQKCKVSLSTILMSSYELQNSSLYIIIFFIFLSFFILFWFLVYFFCFCFFLIYVLWVCCRCTLFHLAHFVFYLTIPCENNNPGKYIYVL